MAISLFFSSQSRTSAENFPGGSGGNEKKRSKISKKYRKIALFASSRRGATEKRPKK